LVLLRVCLPSSRHKVTSCLNFGPTRISLKRLGSQRWGSLTWWNVPKKAWLIILFELGITATLGSWIYATYLNDVHFQTYANSFDPVLVPGLSVAFLASRLHQLQSISTMSMKEMRAVQEPAVSAKKKPSLRKMPKKSSQPSMQPPKASDAVVQTTKPSLSQSRPHVFTLRRKNPLLGKMRKCSVS